MGTTPSITLQKIPRIHELADCGQGIAIDTYALVVMIRGYDILRICTMAPKPAFADASRRDSYIESNKMAYMSVDSSSNMIKLYLIIRFQYHNDGHDTRSTMADHKDQHSYSQVARCSTHTNLGDLTLQVIKEE
ncbi:predicted protein [Lichtheimia corymbifera JMRC:FSU:9682]|uniref:Uncharacterized protein n=1 Tax=Lichtheimia corymbifera JMRC:FSU:9682 TaxID=1263082 RepID=A0A068RLQ5_9FUNG|nr:predicted protein [Lichtheimia corymbifera JMRC:FSU:9682]